VKPGSEVVRIVLEVLPRLKPGTFVHFHDMYLPYAYQRGILRDELFFSAESPFLQAFLVQNERWRITASLSMLHYACPDELRALLPQYRPAANDQGLAVNADPSGHFPTAVYLLATEPRSQAP
jgi:hypothetical protein